MIQRFGQLMLVLVLAWGSGCAGFGYTGKSNMVVASDAIVKERGWVVVQGVPLYRQQGHHDCGPTALAMVLRYWEPSSDVNALLARPLDARVSAADLREIARARGFSAFVLDGEVEDLIHEIKLGRPVIVGVAKPTATGPIAHYEVLIGFHKATQRVATLDPARGWRQNTFAGFLEEWVATGKVLLVVLPRAPATAAVAQVQSGQRANPSASEHPAHD